MLLLIQRFLNINFLLLIWNLGLDRLLLVVLSSSFHQVNCYHCLTTCNFVAWVPARLGGKNLNTLGFLLSLGGGDGCLHFILFLKSFFLKKTPKFHPLISLSLLRPFLPLLCFLIFAVLLYPSQ